MRTIILSILISFSNLAVAQELYDNLKVFTGNITGIYYPTGSSICNIINNNRTNSGIRCKAEISGGSVDNITTIKTHQPSIAIVQSEVQYEAFNRLDDFTDSDNMNLRSLFSLYDEAITIITRASEDISSLKDIKGKRINAGPVSSGNRVAVDRILKSLDWSFDDFESVLEYNNYAQGDALCSGKVDVIFYVIGHPSTLVKEAMNKCDLKFVPIDGKQITKLTASYPYYSKTTIKTENYNNNHLKEEINTIGVKATVIANAKLNDKIAYEITKDIFNNLDTLKQSNPALNDLDPKKMVSQGNTAPIHEGAMKYFKEVNLK